MKTLKVMRLDDRATIPTRATQKSAGLDLYAIQTEKIFPETCASVHTGIAIELPRGYEGQVRPRSGLAAKHQVTVLNAPGTIDADYRGEIVVLLINHGPRPHTINAGDRIAQLVIAPVSMPTPIEVESISDTDRGDGGFGSSGR